MTSSAEINIFVANLFVQEQEPSGRAQYETKEAERTQTQAWVTSQKLFEENMEIPLSAR